MATLTRRAFVMSAGAMAAATAVRGAAPPGAAQSGPATEVSVRAPAPGQTWRYAKLDYFNRAPMGQQTDRVTLAGAVTTILCKWDQGRDEPVALPGRAVDWIHRSAPRAEAPTSAGEELQAPWGTVLVDPHWAQLQVYEKPLPLWPAQLRPDWSTDVNTNYMTPDRDEVMPYELTMNAHRWEYVTVPAGRFRALRYHNQINLRFSNISERVSAQREEDVWFAPEVGRWVARESWGTFYQDVGERLHESSYRWELLAWT